MKPLTRLLLALVATLVIAGLYVARRDTTAPTLAAAYTGNALIDGPLQLTVTISPPVASPRDPLVLQARITNSNPTFASPEIEIQLPSTVHIASGQLPTGVTAHVAKNSVLWLPVVPGSGESRELTLPLTVVSADILNPEQTVDLQLRDGDKVSTASTTIWIGIAPHVEALESAQHVSVGQPLQLKAHVAGPGPIAETWELGDGRQVNVNSPTIVYPTAGVYTVKVTARNPLGEAQFAAPITVVPHVNAAFQPEDDTPGLGQAVAFNNIGGGQGPVQYQWDFGDGAYSTEAQPSHAYSAPGSYTVKLTASNSFGTSESTQQVTVGMPPAADIVVADSAPAGTHLAGEAILAGTQEATEFTWEMGDGRRYSSAKISHAYRQSGDYYVTLTASNEYGETQVGHWVHVEEGILQVFVPMVSYFGGLAQGSSTDAVTMPADAAVVETVLSEPFVMEPLTFAITPSPTSQLLAYINEARRHFELSKLEAAEELSLAAQNHTDDMAAAQHNAHTGSDGSVPAERFLQFGYSSGYAGEATAWGFADPRQAVEFWVNSPSHRAIILNPNATHVGLGYTVDYTAPSVWYWTAEFGNASGQPEDAVLRVQGPTDGTELLNSEPLTFIWNWAAPLGAAEQFTVYLNDGSGQIAAGSVSQPALGTQYRLTFEPTSLPGLLGPYQWQIVLEDSRGAALTASEPRNVVVNLDPSLPTATPPPTATPLASPTVSPTTAPTTTPTQPALTPRPTEPPLPPLVTATPLPLQSPSP